MTEAEMVNRWINDLENEDYSIRMRACRELGESGSSAATAVPMLVKVHLEDSDQYVRYFAKQALDRIQEILEAEKQTVEKLLEELKSEGYAIRLKAARALGNLGATASGAVPALTAVAKNDSDQYVRHFAKEAISKILEEVVETVYDGKTVSEWIHDLDSEDYSVRLRAARSLGKISPPATAAISKLEETMRNDRDEYVRFFAKQALDKIQLN